MGYEVKGYLFRGFLSALEQEGMLAAVKERVSPDVRVVIDTPPLAGAWMGGHLLDAVSDAVMTVHGAAALRRVHSAAVNRGAMTVLRPVAESVMRVAGVSPGKLLSQINRLTQSAVRGMEHQWEDKGPDSGVLTTSVKADVSDAFFEGTAGSIQIVFDLCHVVGRIGSPKVSRKDGTTLGSMDVTWTPRK